MDERSGSNCEFDSLNVSKRDLAFVEQLRRVKQSVASAIV